MARFLTKRAGPDTEALPDLVRIFNAYPSESFDKAKVFTALAEAWLRIGIPQTLPRVPVFPEPSTNLPSARDDYPQELREAVRDFERARAPFLALQRGSTDFQTHQHDYWSLVARLLERKTGPCADDFLAYRWGGYCGTGNQIFVVPQSRALVMALSTDQRWSEAAGAALAVTPATDLEGSLRVLSACVTNPLRVVTGGLAYLDTGPRESRMSKIRMTLLTFLLRLPGDGRVQALANLASHAPDETLKLYFLALGKLVLSSEPSPDTGENYLRRRGLSGRDLDGITARPASPTEQNQAFDFLCARASSELPIEAAVSLAEIFHADPRPEALPALRRLLDHPSLTVAEKAAAALEAAGEKTYIPPKLGRVRYRIEVNGKPYAGRPVEWIASRGEMSTTSEVTTDAEGVAHLPRDIFLDKSPGPIERVVLRSASMPGLDDAWFWVLLPPPPATDDVIPISVQTKPLQVQISLPRPAKEMQGLTMEILLSGSQDIEKLHFGFSQRERLRLPIAAELTFAALMPGVYRMEIRIPGTTGWRGELRAGESSRVTVPLERASDVKYSLRPPPGWRANLFFPQLRREGQFVPLDWDYENSLLRGVPQGRYVLHLPSYAEMKRRVLGMLPDGPEFASVDIPFEVGPESPIDIDLGEIHVDRKSQ
ncbi:MAG TPA: Ig-like domain-containing protein [Terrimicrobiaceae bacterium]